MSEITRGYLEHIEFENFGGKMPRFMWADTNEGYNYWRSFYESNFAEGRAKIEEMIRVWESTEPQPEASAIEYCITAGPGCLKSYGVTTDAQAYASENELYVLHIAPATTSCMTGK